MILSLFARWEHKHDSHRSLRCKATCTKGKSIPERPTDFLKVIPEAAELQIISYKLSEINRKQAQSLCKPQGRE